MYVVTKSISSKDPSCSSVRNWLLFWASLRLAVSVLWTGVLIIGTIQATKYFWYRPKEIYMDINQYVNTYAFGVCAVAWQLVEFGMSVLFIVAGVKKSSSLYRVYFYYSIQTLIIYIISMFPRLILSYRDLQYFGEMYLTYQISKLPILEQPKPYPHDTAFVVVFIIDVCLELLLIKLIKKMVDKYSPVEDEREEEKKRSEKV